MSSIVASRELRNSTRALLDRVDAGEEITITVDGRPVATLTPISRRPDSVSKAEFRRLFEGHQADPGLTRDLEEMLGGETTDDIEDPWGDE